MIVSLIVSSAMALSLPIGQSDTKKTGERMGERTATHPLAKRNPQPIDQNQWISPEVIDARACRGERCFVGFVGFTLLVSAEGRATDCAVTLTSGDRALDVETCNLLLRGARFKPATNAKGEPVKGRYASSVLWTGRSVGPSPD